jgi:long-chain fatty acid transport protein
VPDSISEDQDQVFYNISSTVDRYVLNFNNDDNTYQFGPSLAGEISKNLSVGATLYFHRRSSQMTMNQLVNLSDGSFEWTNQYVELNEQGLRPIAGIMWSPVEKVTIGLAFSKIYVTSSDLRTQLTTKAANPVPSNTIDRSDTTDTRKRDYPLELRAGIAYFASNSLLLTLDGTYYNKVTDRVSVLNAAVGAEYYLDKNWAVRGGLFSDMANTPDLVAGKTDQAEKIDNYGISASISNFTRNTSITLGTSITTGSGKAQLFPGDPSIQNASTFGWNLYLSSSYSY